MDSNKQKIVFKDVRDAEPPLYERVLITDGTLVTQAYYTDKGWSNWHLLNDEYLGEILGWAELPTPIIERTFKLEDLK